MADFLIFVAQKCLFAQFSEKCVQLECVPMPNVTVALPNTGGTLYSRRSLADAHYYRAVTQPRRETR